MKHINGFEKYLADESGNIFSSDYNHSGKTKKLKTYFDKDGYKYIFFVIKNKRIKKQVHRIIAQTFIPNIDNKPQVNHKNGIKDDNRVENLEWVTAKENVIHNYEVLGRIKSIDEREKISKRTIGELNANSKLKKEDVEKIRQMRKNGMMYKDIQKHINISISQIGGICSGKYWKIIGTIHDKEVE